MSSGRRWYTIQGTFGAGILSPAGQDEFRRQEYLSGAAALRNFRVRRDGGLLGREVFVRHPVVLPVPAEGLLSEAASWEVPAPAVVQRQDGGSTEPRGVFAGAHYDTGGDGIAPWFREVAASQADPSADLARVHLPVGARPTAFTFHGVRLLQGRWSVSAPDLRLNLAAWAKPRGGPPVRVLAAPAAGRSESFTAHGSFAPGQIRRDVVIPLNALDALRRAESIEYVSLRVAHRGAATPIQVSVDGFSCFAEAGGGGVPLAADVLRGAVRLLSWPIRNVPFVLGLCMDRALWIQLRPRVEVRATLDTWHFTARQLRELTVARYGGSLLLSHRDFVYPLEVRLGSGDTPFQIVPLALENVPDLPEEGTARVARDVSTEGGFTQISDVRTETGAQVLVPPSQVLLDGTSGALAVRWDPTLGPGQATYEVVFAPRAEVERQIGRSLQRGA